MLMVLINSAFDKLTSLIDQIGFSQLELKFQIVMLMLLGFVLVSLSLMIYLIIIRQVRRRRKAIRKRLQDFYSAALSHFVLDDLPEHSPEQYEQTVKKAFKKFLKGKSYSKLILYRAIVAAHDNFSGEAAKRLEVVFKVFGLSEIAKKQIKSPKWFDRAEAILVLSKMRDSSMIAEIEQYTNHPNDTLRINAQIGYVLLTSKDPLRFFKQVNKPFNLWHQIKMMETLRKLSKKEIPDFSDYFGHSQPTVVIFCLKMTVFFNQFSALPKVAILLRHEEEKVRIAALQVINEMNYSEAAGYVQKSYEFSHSEDEKTAALAALSVVNADLADKLAQDCIATNASSHLLQQAVLTLKSSDRFENYRALLENNSETKIMLAQLENHGK